MSPTRVVTTNSELVRGQFGVKMHVTGWRIELMEWLKADMVPVRDRIQPGARMFRQQRRGAGLPMALLFPDLWALCFARPALRNVHRLTGSLRLDFKEEASSRESPYPNVETTIAANPKDARNLIGASIVSTPFMDRTTIYVSQDGGAVNHCG
jgi:hypothetical protein